MNIKIYNKILQSVFVYIKIFYKNSDVNFKVYSL